MEEKNSTNAVFGIAGIIFAVSSIAMAYFSFENYMNTYQISKSKFICTQIQQVGKNMDDVICTQYTDQKFAKVAMEQNKALAFLSK